MKKLLSLLMSAVLLCAFAVPCVSAETNTALLSYLGGDVNSDWAVTSSDVRVLFAAVSGKAEKGSLSAADANGDGAVNVLDALYAMRVTVDLADTVLLTPSVEEVETAPEETTITFVRGNEDLQYAADSRREENVSIAQSLEELQAIYAHSNSNVDYTEKYTAEFFEDKALIIWDCHCRENGLTGLTIDRIAKDGNSLYLVRNLRIFLQMPYDWFDRYLLEVSKEDLVGIDTIYTCTEYTYVE